MHTDVLRTLATNFGSNSLGCAKAIREMYRLDPVGFPPAVVEVLDREPDLPGAQFMVAMLASDPRWLRTVCNPQKYTLDQSVDLVRRSHKLDSYTVVKLADMLALPGSSTDAEARFTSRVFAVLERSAPSLALPVLRQLSKCPDARVRSKAVLLIGRIYQNPRLTHHGDAERDPRVAANTIESLWGLATPSAREAFIKAAQDAHHRIAANGVVGLYLMGDECSIPFLFHMGRSDKPLARAAAAWAMGHLEDPRFLPRLAQLREDSDSLTRQGALRAMARVHKKLTQMSAAGALEVQIQDCECRGESQLVRFTVTKEARSVNDLDLRQFVAWNGADLVEEFVSSLCGGASPFYEIAYQGAPSPTNQVKVQVYAASGVGEDAGPEKTFS
jgi:hypothetical protein